ncbi:MULTISPECIES: helix-turn-helix domain-containing protein [Bacillus]|uniref:Helix-turn-helix domain-containing protein n=1 Tax=Bacillus subtilis TaxID=1423 RepID=A0A8I2BAP4_BACIU|nr:helix-turn-helix domain-containing protein [Bacillus subtilis]MBO3796290.1 helix-turn-helix domain-containing protein [Bacillus subtilis]MBT2165580.1 helix-turn-helix domain-containing protein [Bacillus subtilis]MCR1990227.1 helix-turn-helix domain-containing protein [Bacillus subtilis]MDD9765688.1 helix-turn-helix domain-containing protein [Bacillus subtilis]MDD9768644.1 helix-turn-helix domain-containing protein [Bacillus subtilis]
MSELNFKNLDELKDFIRVQRAYNKISSVKLSEMLGKNRAYISQIENGHNKNPEYETLFNMFKIFGINGEEIDNVLGNYGVCSNRHIAKQLKDQNKIETHFLSNEDMESINQRLKNDAKNIAEELEGLNDTSKEYLIKLLQEQLSK